MASKVQKVELDEIVIPKKSTTTKFVFPDMPNLLNVHLWRLEFYQAEIVPKSIITQLPLIPVALYQQCFVTLQTYNGKNIVDRKPLVSLTNTVLLNGSPTPFSWFPSIFVGQKINWKKSFIEFVDNTLFSQTDDQVVLFEVGYSEMAEKEAAQKKANFRNQS